jgi:hypothetical protein
MSRLQLTRVAQVAPVGAASVGPPARNPWSLQIFSHFLLTAQLLSDTLYQY